MSQQENGIATRDDVNTLGYERFVPGAESEPNTKCVVNHELMDDQHYRIYGNYSDNQLLKFQDIALLFIPQEPEDEEEPESGNVFEHWNEVLISNTGCPGEFYLPENGNGLLTVSFDTQVLGTNGVVYPTGGSTEYDRWYHDTKILSIEPYDNTYFSAWTISDGTRLCVSALTDNTGFEEKRLTLMLHCYVNTQGVGACYDDIAYIAVQEGYLYRCSAITQSTIYYDQYGGILTDMSAIDAAGTGYAKISCRYTPIWSKTGLGTWAPYGNETTVICTPKLRGVNPGRFSFDETNKKVTAQNWGSVTGYSVSVSAYGTYEYNGETYQTANDVLITQSGNFVTTTETTTSFSLIFNKWSDFQDGIDITGTTTPYEAQQRQIHYGWSSQVILASDFSAYRDYGWVSRYTSGVFISSGIASTQYISSCNTMDIYSMSASGMAHIANPIDDDYHDADPCLIVTENNTFQTRDVTISVGYNGGHETPYPSGNYLFTQYCMPQTVVVWSITDVWVRPGYSYPNDNPSNGTYSIPYNMSGSVSALRLVTAECASVTYIIQNGTTSATQSRVYVPEIDPDNLYPDHEFVNARAFLYGVEASHFAIDNPKRPGSGDTDTDTEMHYDEISGHDCLYVEVYPRTANNTGSPITCELRIEFYETRFVGSPAAVKTITLIHEART